MIEPGDKAHVSSDAVAARADFCGPAQNGAVLRAVLLSDIPRQASSALEPTRAIAATHPPSATPSPAMQQPQLLDHLGEDLRSRHYSLLLGASFELRCS